jgi:transposase
MAMTWPIRWRAPRPRCAIWPPGYQALDAEIIDLDRQLARLVKQARPDLLALKGVGTETAAQLLITCGDNPDRLTSQAAFASLCGVSPVPASSGKTQRHRLNRGGDRQANRALYLIALFRTVHDPRTRAYVQRRTRQGRTKREILRCLKRYIARELYKILTRPQTPATQPNDLPATA